MYGGVLSVFFTRFVHRCCVISKCGGELFEQCVLPLDHQHYEAKTMHYHPLKTFSHFGKKFQIGIFRWRRVFMANKVAAIPDESCDAVTFSIHMEMAFRMVLKKAFRMVLKNGI